MYNARHHSLPDEPRVPMSSDDDFLTSLYFRSKKNDGLNETASLPLSEPVFQNEELMGLYQDLVSQKRHSWTTHLRMIRELGRGGQGIVYMTQRRGADGFTLPVALKVFSPERYPSPEEYDADMGRMATVASQVARLQHENLLQVYNFLDRDRIRMMVMEWVEGFDLRRLMTPKMFGIVKRRFSEKRWNYVNDVLITIGEEQPRFRPGVAVAIVRECLEGLAVMHRHGLVHGDVKPANIMLKRSGHAKMIDMGSAFETSNPLTRKTCTPAYAATEVLEGGTTSPLSDLASVGYVLLELIAGRRLFPRFRSLEALIESKKTIWEWLPELLPPDVWENELLMGLCRGLTDPDPSARFQSAEAAEYLDEHGASAFHRQLIKADLASDYDQDLRIWIEELLEIDELVEYEAS